MLPLSKDEIPKMRAAGRLASRTLDAVGKILRAGMTTNEINTFVHKFTLEHGAKPAPLGYHGFPKSVCTSINDVICHGVPDETVLKAGDIINVHVTCIKEGFYGAASRTFFVGEVSDAAKEITDAAEKAMFKGIEQVR